MQDPGGVRDDGEVFLLLQAGQQGEACRARVDHETVAVVHEGGGLGGDDLLVLAHDGIALEEGDILPRVFAQYSTAVAAAQQILALKLFEVTADRLLRHIEKFRKLRDIDLLFIVQLLHDLLTAFDTQHDGKHTPLIITTFVRSSLCISLVKESMIHSAVP